MEGPDPRITNEAERLPRPIAIQRLIRKHHAAEEGTSAFGRITACAPTRRKRGLNAYDGFYRRLSTAWPLTKILRFLLEGRSAHGGAPGKKCASMHGVVGIPT